MAWPPADPAAAVLGSAACEAMLRCLAIRLGGHPSRLWYDDLLQAARVRLWEQQPAVALWPVAARRAMLDELDRLLGVPGSARAQAHHDDDTGPEPVCPAPRPEDHAHAAQVLQRLNGAAEALLPVLLQADSLADAGRVLGLSESGVCLRVQAMTARALAMADRPSPPAAPRPKALRPHKHRLPQKNTERAVADAQRLLYLPGLQALAQLRLQALVQHGCAKRAAAALGCKAQNIRVALHQARQAAL